MSATSDDLPDPTDLVSLRREALLPNERSRGLGTVAVVCTMAGVASGLALATTLMAMQVADTMSTRSSCPYQVEVATVSAPVEQHGFLGIRYVFRDGSARIDSVIPGSPAEAIQLHPGDKVLAFDGSRIMSTNDLQQRVYHARPNTNPSLVVERADGSTTTYFPTLAAWPVTY
ncbi:MAG: PDZ domain-containing protein [Proteobacteria bacterium]|nr:PDZ domain-containing protein [Pseudomonadota bacterium]